jgi:hypothetical protein
VKVKVSMAEGDSEGGATRKVSYVSVSDVSVWDEKDFGDEGRWMGRLGDGGRGKGACGDEGKVW